MYIDSPTVTIDTFLTALDVITMCKKGDPAPPPGKGIKGIQINDGSSNLVNLHLSTVTKTSVAFIMIFLIALLLYFLHRS